LISNKQNNFQKCSILRTLLICSIALIALISLGMPMMRSVAQGPLPPQGPLASHQPPGPAPPGPAGNHAKHHPGRGPPSPVYPLQSSVETWIFNKGTNIQTSSFTIAVGLVGTDPARIPKQIQVIAWITHNGVQYWETSLSIDMWGNQETATLIYSAPFDGGGEYVFYATFVSGGVVVAQQVVDPKIEPEY
jgi:hypothetical protein